MDQKKLMKPEHLKEEVWEQHLDWMEVMGKQVEANFNRHRARVEEDANRSETLQPLHEEGLQAEHRTQHLFSTPKH